jgi:hypothetical protein
MWQERGKRQNNTNFWSTKTRIRNQQEDFGNYGKKMLVRILSKCDGADWLEWWTSVNVHVS